MLLAGEVSLTTISLVSKVITSENKAELLAKLRGASRSDVEKLLASMQGTGREIRDRIKPVAGKAVARQGVTAAESQGSLGQVAKETEKGIQESTEQGTEQSTARTSAGGGFDTGNPLQQSDTETQRYEIRCAVSAEVRDKLERTRELLSNKLPLGVVLEDVLNAALECYLEKHAPERRAVRRSARAAKKAEDTGKEEDQSTLDTPTRSSSRHIPAEVKDSVYLRDGGQCSYVGPTGLRCSCRTRLNFDHIVPRAHGGTNCEFNIRILCSAHNQLMADKILGEPFMRAKRYANSTDFGASTG